MNEIARFTTPAIIYKPSMVEIANIDEIFLVVKQNGREILRKGKTDATVSTTTGFTWMFTQQDTSALNSRAISMVQIDYTSGAMRYTTYPKPYNITESAISEVI